MFATTMLDMICSLPHSDHRAPIAAYTSADIASMNSSANDPFENLSKL